MRRIRLAAVGLFGLVATSVALCPSAAAAGAGAVDEAHAACERGAAAFDRHDYAVAARELARADELVPSTIALTTAIKAAVLGDLVVLGMELVERAEGRAFEPSLFAAKDKARAKFEGRSGRLSISCPRVTCRAEVDGEHAAAGAARWVEAGKHEVVLDVDGRPAEHRTVDVAARTIVDVSPAPQMTTPPARGEAPEAEPARSGGGLSPLWFFLAAGTTAVIGGATIASAVDWKSKHDAFLEHQTEELSVDGQAAQTRTNVLVAVTGGVLVATALLGIFGTRWRSPDARAPRASLRVARPSMMSGAF